jgi:ubiquinone/menaquinone biosynthesis C-methylase UbiE
VPPPYWDFIGLWHDRDPNNNLIMTDASLHQRESEFHDQWAASTDLSRINVEEFFEAPTALENRFILHSMGNLKGRKLLDIGCGLGESSVYFAKKGAEVTALDLSPGMVETAKKLAHFHGVTLQGVVSPGEDLPVPDNAYDFVYCANTIHHVPDRERLYREIRRVLKPGGSFYSWDPLDYNPAINVYRRLASGVRTPDEQPLRTSDVAIIKRHFEAVQWRTFWIASLAVFLKYYFIDRTNPNQQRYWKLIYKPQPLWWWHPLRCLDELLCRIPAVRWLAWNIVISGRKPNP